MEDENYSFVPFGSIYSMELSQDCCWGKLLKGLPLFSIKEIEKHHLQSGKTPETAIIKTLERGRKFKEERYISADSIFSKCDNDCYIVLLKGMLTCWSHWKNLLELL